MNKTLWRLLLRVRGILRKGIVSLPLTLFAGVTLAVRVSFADAPSKECKEWFAKGGVSTGDPQCDLKCAMLPADMATFDCPSQCDLLCKPPKKKELLRYYGPTSDLCDQELDLIKQHPLEAKYVRDAKNAVLRATKVRFSGNFRDDESDAFRHCMWSALIATNNGTDKPDRAMALNWLDAHESCSDDPDGSAMDNFNNRAGIGIAERLSAKGILSSQAVISACYDAAYDGTLKVLRPVGRR